MITWPICALVLGLALIAAAWDGVRRYSSSRGIEARVTAQLDKRLADQTAQLDKRLADHREYIDTLKRGVDAYVGQTTAEISALKSGLNVRTMRAG